MKDAFVTKRKKPEKKTPSHLKEGISIDNTVQKAGMRLNKAIADRGFCSRRKADDLIFAGRVMVNGVAVLEPGTRVIVSDTISIDGKEIVQADQKKTYLMLHKPIHTVSTVFDPEGRPTVLDCLPEQYKKIRLYPVGRLDYFSEGLLLLTNDGELTHTLLHPRFHLPKTYHVTVRGFVPSKTLTIMQQGMTLSDGQKLMPVTVHATSLGHDTTLLSFILHQGINRQIRRMCEELHLTILKLVRIAEGPLSLGTLEYGAVRELTAKEIMMLKKLCHTTR